MAAREGPPATVLVGPLLGETWDSGAVVVFETLGSATVTVTARVGAAVAASTAVEAVDREPTSAELRDLPREGDILVELSVAGTAVGSLEVRCGAAAGPVLSVQPPEARGGARRWGAVAAAPAGSLVVHAGGLLDLREATLRAWRTLVGELARHALDPPREVMERYLPRLYGDLRAAARRQLQGLPSHVGHVALPSSWDVGLPCFADQEDAMVPLAQAERWVRDACAARGHQRPAGVDEALAGALGVPRRDDQAISGDTHAHSWPPGLRLVAWAARCVAAEYHSAFRRPSSRRGGADGGPWSVGPRVPPQTPHWDWDEEVHAANAHAFEALLDEQRASAAVAQRALQTLHGAARAARDVEAAGAAAVAAVVASARGASTEAAVRSHANAEIEASRKHVAQCAVRLYDVDSAALAPEGRPARTSSPWAADSSAHIAAGGTHIITLDLTALGMRVDAQGGHRVTLSDLWACGRACAGRGGPLGSLDSLGRGAAWVDAVRAVLQTAAKMPRPGAAVGAVVVLCSAIHTGARAAAASAPNPVDAALREALTAASRRLHAGFVQLLHEVTSGVDEGDAGVLGDLRLVACGPAGDVLEHRAGRWIAAEGGPAVLGSLLGHGSVIADDADHRRHGDGASAPDPRLPLSPPLVLASLLPAPGLPVPASACPLTGPLVGPLCARGLHVSALLGVAPDCPRDAARTDVTVVDLSTGAVVGTRTLGPAGPASPGHSLHAPSIALVSGVVPLDAHLVDGIRGASSPNEGAGAAGAATSGDTRELAVIVGLDWWSHCHVARVRVGASTLHVVHTPDVSLEPIDPPVAVESTGEMLVRLTAAARKWALAKLASPASPACDAGLEVWGMPVHADALRSCTAAVLGVRDAAGASWAAISAEASTVAAGAGMGVAEAAAAAILAAAARLWSDPTLCGGEPLPAALAAGCVEVASDAAFAGAPAFLPWVHRLVHAWAPDAVVLPASPVRLVLAPHSEESHWLEGTCAALERIAADSRHAAALPRATIVLSPERPMDNPPHFAGRDARSDAVRAAQLRALKGMLRVAETGRLGALLVMSRASAADTTALTTFSALGESRAAWAALHLGALVLSKTSPDLALHRPEHLVSGLIRELSGTSGPGEALMLFRHRLLVRGSPGSSGDTHRAAATSARPVALEARVLSGLPAPLTPAQADVGIDLGDEAPPPGTDLPDAPTMRANTSFALQGGDETSALRLALCADE